MLYCQFMEVTKFIDTVYGSTVRTVMSAIFLIEYGRKKSKQKRKERTKNNRITSSRHYIKRAFFLQISRKPFGQLLENKIISIFLIE